MRTGSNPFMLPVPGKDLKGVIAYRDIADTDAMIEAATHAQARGRHRRRPAGPRSGQRPDAARHERHRGARHAMADGAPARRRGRQAAAEVARRARPEVPHRRADRRNSWATNKASGRVKAVRFKDGTEVAADLVVMAVGIRPNTELAEKARPALQPRHRRHRHHADRDRRAHLRGRRMRCASRHRLRPGGAAVRAGQGLRPTTWRSSASAATWASLTSTKLKVTGIDLFSAGEFMGGEGTEEIVLSRPASAASTRSW